MPNVDEVGKWINHLNGKPTYLMESAFRQCALNIHYEPYWDEPSSYEETERRKVHLAVQLVKKYPDDKFICFIHGKRIGETLMRFLQSAGVRCEYHNAGIPKDKRLKIEKDFREDPSLRVVVATSGLGQGLNMPARRVIVLGIHRGLSEVKTQEIIQECGRAGRPSYDKEGDAYILLPRRKFEQHKKRLQEPVYIQSQMLSNKVLAFHIVSEIHHRNIRNMEDVYKWYGRTLAHFQKQELDEEVVEEVIKNLIFSGCIREEGGEYTTTPVGTVASMFYYSPFDVADLYKNFNNIFKTDHADYDNWIAMALGNTETHRLGIVNTAEKEEIDSFINEIYSDGDKIERVLCPRSFTMGTMRAGYCYKQLLEGYYSKNLSNMMQQLQMDFGRTTEILSAIDSMGAKWGQTQFFKDLSLRIAYGVPAELVDLTRIKGIGKVKAGKLFNAGLKTPKDLTVEGVVRALKCSKKVAEEVVADAKKV
jgi:helicase